MYATVKYRLSIDMSNVEHQLIATYHFSFFSLGMYFFYVLISVHCVLVGESR